MLVGTFVTTPLQASAAACHSEGFDVAAWLEDPARTPSASYLASAAVSYPMVGLVQMGHYMAMLGDTGKTHEELVGLFKGATGHSQGIVSAVAIARYAMPCHAMPCPAMPCRASPSQNSFWAVLQLGDH